MALHPGLYLAPGRNLLMVYAPQLPDQVIHILDKIRGNRNPFPPYQGTKDCKRPGNHFLPMQVPVGKAAPFMVEIVHDPQKSQGSPRKVVKTLLVVHFTGIIGPRVWMFLLHYFRIMGPELPYQSIQTEFFIEEEGTNRRFIVLYHSDKFRNAS